MTETSCSLLYRAKNLQDKDAWTTLTSIYTPLIQAWLRRDIRLDANDADDVTQNVMTVVVRRLSEFERQRTGSFRAWLKLITVNCLHQHFRDRRGAADGNSHFQDILNQLTDTNAGLSRIWDREHDEHVMRKVLDLLRSEFTEQTWKAFELMALDGQSAESVGAQLGITSNAVFIAKSRILRRMREVASELLD